jgi:hypothetical protein
MTTTAPMATTENPPPGGHSWYNSRMQDAMERFVLVFFREGQDTTQQAHL